MIFHIIFLFQTININGSKKLEDWKLFDHDIKQQTNVMHQLQFSDKYIDHCENDCRHCDQGAYIWKNLHEKEDKLHAKVETQSTELSRLRDQINKLKMDQSLEIRQLKIDQLKLVGISNKMKKDLENLKYSNFLFSKKK